MGGSSNWSPAIISLGSSWKTVLLSLIVASRMVSGSNGTRAVSFDRGVSLLTDGDVEVSDIKVFDAKEGVRDKRISGLGEKES